MTPCKQTEAIHSSVDYRLYCIPAFWSRVTKTFDVVSATELNTVIPVRQLRGWDQLLCSAGPTQALIVEDFYLSVSSVWI